MKRMKLIPASYLLGSALVCNAAHDASGAGPTKQLRARVLEDESVPSGFEDGGTNGTAAPTPSPANVTGGTLAPTSEPVLPCVETRYVPWHELNQSMRETAAEILEYTADTWNIEYTNQVEKLSWFGLTEKEREGASDLGFEEETWDCWVNHYNDYDWDELEEFELSEPLEKSGVTEEMWMNDLDTDFYNKSWAELNETEKATADMFCYFQGNWDQLNLTDYNSTCGDDAESDEQVSSPSPSPTHATESTASPTGVVGEALDCVGSRYVPWDELDGPWREAAASKLNYTEDTWNYEYVNLVERKAWESLSDGELEGAATLGFDLSSWDCWVNHYDDYFWDDLGVISSFLSAIGVDEEVWVGNTTNPYANVTWEQLNDNEKKVFELMCYFRENWNQEHLSNYTIVCSATPENATAIPPIPSENVTSTVQPTASPVNGTVQPTASPVTEEDPFYCTSVRYVSWDELDELSREVAGSGLDYEKDSWDVEFTNPVEKKSWGSLTESEQKAAEKLVFDEDTWDCWVNHFEDYDWEELEEFNISGYYETVGITPEIWEEEENTIWEKKWEEFSDAEKEALGELCYFQENWDQLNLANYTLDCPFDDTNTTSPIEAEEKTKPQP